MTQTLDSLESLLVHELSDLRDGEQQLTKALPRLAKAASSPQLRDALREHLEQTERQRDHLDEVFDMLEQRPKRHKCRGMQGIIEEGREVLESQGDPHVKDAAIIAAAQRVEHYEMAGYGAARTFAQFLGRNDVADRLQQILDQEGDANRKLTEVALASVDRSAMESGGVEWQSEQQRRSARRTAVKEQTTTSGRSSKAGNRARTGSAESGTSGNRGQGTSSSASRARSGAAGSGATARAGAGGTAERRGGRGSAQTGDVASSGTRQAAGSRRPRE